MPHNTNTPLYIWSAEQRNSLTYELTKTQSSRIHNSPTLHFINSPTHNLIN